MPTASTPRVQRWESATDVPLVVLALVFLFAYALPILDPDVSSGVRTLCHWLNWGTWVVFAVEYAIRLTLARSWSYFGRHLLDLAMVALPMLRPLRLLRLLLLLRILNRRATTSLRGHVATYVGGAAVILMFCASLAVLQVERNAPHSNIRSFGDAVWWAITTVTTVGYGDTYPVTVTGRLVASALMLGGVALIGVVTGTFASWLVDKVQMVTESSQAVTRADIAELRDQLAELRSALVERGPDPDPGQGSR